MSGRGIPIGPDDYTPVGVYWNSINRAYDTLFSAADLSRAGSGAKPELMRGTDKGWDAAKRSWEGQGGLRYRVPLQDLPGESHCRTKTRNVRVLLDNMRRMCMSDLLPATQEEKQFWTKYRFVKYQLWGMPFLSAMPALWVGMKIGNKYMPHGLQGRFVPVVLASFFADCYLEYNFPAHELLSKALAQKTPLGDAARADWQRLQPLDITYVSFIIYNWKLFLGSPMEEFAFGGDARSVA